MIRILTLAMALLSGGAVAATTDVTRDTEGYGATQQEAVANALVEAVRQVRGSAAGVDRDVRETMTVVATGAGAIVEKTTTPVADVYTVSRGYVRSYQVLEQRQTDKGFYARIRAVVPSFESAVSDAGKQRVAVLPFRIATGSYQLADHGSAPVFSQRLADRLVSELAQAPELVLVNRDFFAELGVEKAVLGADAAPEELVKLGASVGADFLLVGRVQEARTESEAGAYGSKAKKVDEIRLSWRMIEAATGKLLRAGELSFDHVRPVQANYSWRSRDDFEAGELFAALARHIAAEARGKPVPAPVVAPAATSAPAELTPGSSDKPLQW